MLFITVKYSVIRVWSEIYDYIQVLYLDPYNNIYMGNKIKSEPSSN